MSERKNKAPDVYQPYKVFRNFAFHLAKLHQDDKALIYFHLAEDYAKNNDMMVPILIRKAKAECALALLTEARNDADRVLRMAPNNLNALYTHAYVFYQEDKFEDSLIEHQVGLCKRTLPDNFANGVRVATGTIEDCIGYNAGEITELNILGGIIVKMKLKELDLYVENTSITEVERRRKMKVLQAKKRCFAERHLETVAKEKHFMIDVLDDPALFCSNEANNVWLEDILNEGIKKLQRKQESLWRRKPLYTHAYQSAHPSLKLIEEQKLIRQHKRKLLENEILRQLNEVNELMLDKAWSKCYFKAEKLRELLMAQSEALLPQKSDYLKTVYHIMGDMYLTMKNFIRNWDQSQNDKRILHMLGVFKPYEVCMELYRESFHAPIPDIKKFDNQMLDCLSLSDDTLENVYFSYELACSFSLQHKVEQMRFYTRQCIFEAKKIGNIIWFINSLFMLARTELQDYNLMDAQVTLTALKEACQKFSMLEPAAFVERALTLLQREKEEDLYGLMGIAKREKTLVRVMATNDLRFAAMKLLQRMNSLPANQRMSIIPGVRPTKKKRVRTEPDEALELSPEEEERINQTIQDRIRRRFTFQLRDYFSVVE